MANITVVLGGVTLPEPDVPFKRINIPNETDVRPLDGTLYTDFVSRLRGWRLEWGSLSEADYDAIVAIYEAQYTTEVYPVLEIEYYDIIAAVKVNRAPEADIRRGGTCIRGFWIELLEKYAVS